MVLVIGCRLRHMRNAAGQSNELTASPELLVTSGSSETYTDCSGLELVYGAGRDRDCLQGGYA